MALFGGIAGGIVGGATVKLLLDDSQFKAGLASAKGETEAAAGTMGKFGGAAKLAFASAGIAVLGFAKASVDAYSQHEEALAQLEGTIKRMPGLAGATTKAFEDQALALEHLTGFTDTEILSADNILARFKLTTAQIQQAIPVVLDYARATGTAVPDAAANIGKALLGNTRALKTVGIQFTATGNTGKDFGNILDLLKGKIGGAAEEFGTTAAGKFAIAETKFHDMAVTVGGALVPALTGLLSVLTPLLGPLAAVAKNAGTLLLAFLAYKAIGFLPALLTGVATALETLGAEQTAQKIIGIGAAIDGMGAAASAAAAGGLALGILAFQSISQASQQAKQAIDDAAKSIVDDGNSMGAALYEAQQKGDFKATLDPEGFTADVEKQIKALDDAAKHIAQLNIQAKTLKQIQSSFSGLELLPGLKYTADTAGLAAKATRDAAGNISMVGQAAQGATAPIKNWGAAAKEAATQAKNLYLAQLSLAGGFLGVEGAALSLAQSEGDLKKANQDVNKLQADGKKGTQDYKDAILAQKQAVLGAAQSYFGLKQSVQDYIQQNKGSKASTQDAIQQIKQLGAQHIITKDQVHALIAEVQGLITKYGGIPNSVKTDISNNASDSMGALQEYWLLLSKIPTHKDVSIVTHYSTVGTPGTAGGPQ